MDYFDIANKKNYIAGKGEKYNANSPACLWFKDSRKKLKHLVTLLGKEVGENLINNYDEQPNKMAGRGKGFSLKHYILTGFVPEKYKYLKKNAFIKLTFYFSDNDLKFGINIDVNYSDEKNKYTSDRDKLQSYSHWSIPLDDNFPKDWQSLLVMITPIIKQRIIDFKNHFSSPKTSLLNEPSEKYNIENTTEENNTMKQPLNQILYGPPGTGKTYNTINKALELIGETVEGETRSNLKDLFDIKVSEGQIVFTTFHQNMSYEDFIEGIKPDTVNNNVIYKIEDGIFKKLCSKASEKKTSKNFDESYAKFIDEVLTKGSITLETPTHKKKFSVIINSNETAVAIPETEKKTNMGVTKEMSRDYIINGAIRDWKPYTTSIGEYIKKHYPVDIEEVNNSNKKFVIIIDEINRGNVSKIFGELITLIEESKRYGKSEALTAKLPYSKKEFSVPDNVYILGTMNTADRSVEALDTALRRRFDFIEMMPKYDLIESAKIADYQINGYYAFDILETINNRLEVLLGRDHLIGHSFFLLDENETIEPKVKSAFYKNIIPLLQEYFYGDYNKIGLVLGSGFVKKNEVVKAKELFADNKKFSGDDYANNAHTFEIIDYTDVTKYSDNTAFYLALNTLMNKTATSEENA